jgi:hypothetical protein
MSTERRFNLVLIVSLILAAIAWIAVLPGLMTASTAMWVTFAIAVAALVAVKFRRHAELPGSVKLH